jgi:hypothetical protein
MGIRRNYRGLAGRPSHRHSQPTSASKATISTNNMSSATVSRSFARCRPTHQVDPASRARQRVSCKPEPQRTASRHHAGDNRLLSGPRRVAPNRKRHRLYARIVVDCKLPTLRLLRPLSSLRFLQPLVPDANGQAKLLTMNEARRNAVDLTRLPSARQGGLRRGCAAQ